MNVPVLPAGTDEPTPNRAAKRITMDFSLLSVPLFDSVQDYGSVQDKAGLNGQTNPSLEVFMTECTSLLCAGLCTMPLINKLKKVFVALGP